MAKVQSHQTPRSESIVDKAEVEYFRVAKCMC